MAEFKLGRLKFWWKGVWQTSHAYVKDDVVSYGGKTYVCLGAHTSGINDETFYTAKDTAPYKWELMQDGIQWKGAWTTGIYYKEGDIVKYGSDTYICIDGHTADADFWEDEGVNWQNFVNGVELEGDWSSSYQYQVGDIVRYGGNTYLAKQDNLNANPETSTANWGLFVHGLKWTGNYSSSTAYHAGDVVQLGTSSYVCILSVTGTSPLEDLSNTYWNAVAQGDLSVNLTTTGDMLVYGTGAIQRLPAGLDNAVLQIDAATNVPAWKTDVTIAGELTVTGNAHIINGDVFQGVDAMDLTVDVGVDDVTSTVDAVTKAAGNITIHYNVGSPLASATTSYKILFEGLQSPHEVLNTEWTVSAVDTGARTVTINGTGISGSGAISTTGATITSIAPDAYYGLTNASGVFVGDADDFVQLSLKNRNDGTAASTDLIAYADNGDNNSGWVDLGITSSGFNNPEFSVTGPNDGYIFMSAPAGSTGKGDLIIGTGDGGTNNDITFFTGGFDAANVKMQIIGTSRVVSGETVEPGVVITMPTTSENFDEGALRVQGGIGVSGNLCAQGDLRSEGGILAQGTEAIRLTEDDYVYAGYVGLTDTSAILTGNADSFVQVAVKNNSTGTSASTDMILYSSGGDNDSGWIDMGICSENYDDPSFGVTGKGDGYIFMSAKEGSTDELGNLFVSTSGNGTQNDIVFSTGGFEDSTFERMRVIGTSRPGKQPGVEIYSTSNADSTTTGALRVSGGIGLQGNLFVGGSVNIDGDTTIAGEIVIGGGSTTLTSQNLAVQDAMIFVADGNSGDVLDSGLVTSYRVEADAYTPTPLTGAGLTATGETLYISKENHGASALDRITVSGLTSNTIYNGTYNTITIVDANTISVVKTGATYSGVLVGGTVSRGAFVNGMRYGGMVRDHGTGRFRFFTALQQAEKPSTTVTFSSTTPGTIECGPVYASSFNGPGVFTTASFSNDVAITASTASTSATTGALKVTGGVGIQGALHVTAASFFYNDITSWYSSDRNLKDNIAPIEGALAKISQIGGYTFDWKPEADKNEAHDVGVIAQEVQAVLPEVVVERDNGYLAVNYEKLVPLLIQGIKELQEEVNALKAKLK